MVKVAIEYITAKGHKNIRATHETTFEITKENWLTPRGDCIIGISASKSPLEFSSRFKEIIRREKSTIIAILFSGGFSDHVIGKGSPKLTLTNKSRMIFRKSEYVNDGTVAIKVNKAAKDLNRNLINRLKKGEQLHLYLVAIAQS